MWEWGRGDRGRRRRMRRKEGEGAREGGREGEWDRRELGEREIQL